MQECLVCLHRKHKEQKKMDLCDPPKKDFSPKGHIDRKETKKLVNLSYNKVLFLILHLIINIWKKFFNYVQYMLKS
jgi:hypothetical protein